MDQIPSSLHQSERMTLDLDDGRDEDQEMVSVLPDAEIHHPALARSMPRSQSLPSYGSDDFPNSSPPRRVSSVLNEYNSDGDTILVRETPLFSPSGRPGSLPRFPQRNHIERPAEHTRLRMAVLDLREQLTASKGIIDNLRSRNQVHELGSSEKEAQLRAARGERDKALQSARDTVDNDCYKARTLLTLVGLVVLMSCAYCYWCWYFGPEMSYIRERRRAVFFD